MNRSNIAVFLSLVCVAACGSQIVEFSGDGGADAGRDASSDATSDAHIDAVADQSADVGPEASGDGAPEPTDAGRDATTDSGGDAGTDASGDAGTDARTDAGGDASTDAGDAGIDASGDAAADATTASVPVITSVTPTNGATEVSINERPTATFNQAMNPASITPLTFTLMQGTTPIVGVVTYDAATDTATFTPNSPLGLGLVYTVTITTGVSSLGGARPPVNDVWSFTTGACSQSPVFLGAAASFVVLAGSTVTSTGPSVLTGDMGVSPGTAITGFPPGTITGTQHANDPTSAQAVADLGTAYLNASMRMLCPITISGNIGGQTLPPGLYNSTSTLAISAGDLTLDAQGDGNAVFIFQIASALTVTSGRQVFLLNGASASNVFWQVGSSATFGTTSAFQGTVMAAQAITLDTGATLNGRALASTSAVALDSNIIVKPLP